MSKVGTHTRIPRYAAQMDPNELSPLTVKHGVILDKPRRRDTQVSDTALARASAILHSPHATPQVTPGSSSSSSSRMQKVNKQMMLEHFANLDIAMVYQNTDDDDDNQADAVEENKRSNRRRRRGSHESKDSMDMAEMFWSEH